LLAKLENKWPKIKKGSVKRKKKLSPGWRVGFGFLFANPEFYLHLASWQVVNTPDHNKSREHIELERYITLRFLVYRVQKTMCGHSWTKVGSIKSV
jgi:hypothetical protein